MRWLSVPAVLLVACGSPAGGERRTGMAADSSTWFHHVEDNSRFIERAHSMNDSGAFTDTVIYTDTWSGQAKYDFSDTMLNDTTPAP